MSSCRTQGGEGRGGGERLRFRALVLGLGLGVGSSRGCRRQEVGSGCCKGQEDAQSAVNHDRVCERAHRLRVERGAQGARDSYVAALARCAEEPGSAWVRTAWATGGSAAASLRPLHPNSNSNPKPNLSPDPDPNPNRKANPKPDSNPEPCASQSPPAGWRAGGLAGGRAGVEHMAYARPVELWAAGEREGGDGTGVTSARWHPAWHLHVALRVLFAWLLHVLAPSSRMPPVATCKKRACATGLAGRGAVVDDLVAIVPPEVLPAEGPAIVVLVLEGERLAGRNGDLQAAEARVFLMCTLWMFVPPLL
eukprot:jgi/Mesen1/3272/ME000019S02689